MAEDEKAEAEQLSNRSLEDDDDEVLESHATGLQDIDFDESPDDEDDDGSSYSSNSLICHSNKKKVSNEKEKTETKQPVRNNSFSMNTTLYKFTECLAEYNRLYKDAHPCLMMEATKYFIETEKNGVGHLDLLFAEFCNFTKMEKLKNLPVEGGEKVFCWLGKRKAMEVLATLRPDHHFVNRLPYDVYLKDKQSMAFTLRSHIMKQESSYLPHFCPYLNQQIGLQLLCIHHYQQHSFFSCVEPKCWENMKREANQKYKTDRLHIGDPCQCFNDSLFVPETHIFNSAQQQNVFVEQIKHYAPQAQWMVKPSYLRGGRGVRIFANAEQLRKFLKIDPSNRHMWGQDYAVQRYVNNPMLTTHNHKFDIRMFLLVVVCKFQRVLGFLHPGYVRKAAAPFEPVTAKAGFKAKSHLVNTRVWQKFAPKPTVEQTSKQAKQAKKKPVDKKKGLKMARDLVPIVGFFENNFAEDECEDYNYAVRHGCLKGRGLPVIQSGTKMPPPSIPKPPPTHRQRIGDPPPPVYNDSFLQALDAIAKHVCSSVFKQVKEKTNCYQMFSLDMCIDSNSKPWLLEVNPSIITENVNWESLTIKEIVPAILIESLGIVFECMKKSLNFLPLRTPADEANKTQGDLVMRQNFIWCYTSPTNQCRLFEMKAEKYAMEKAYKYDLTSKGIPYLPVDYYPEKNAKMPNLKGIDSYHRPARPRFPTPVADIPVLEEDVDWSLRYRRAPVNYIKRQMLVRRLQAKAKRRQKINERRRHRVFQQEKLKEKHMPRQRFDIGH